MKKRLGLFAVAAVLSMNACTLQTVADELADDLEKAAIQAKVETVFNEAVTGVTFASLAVALQAVTAEVAAAPNYSPLANTKNVQVDSTTNDKNGATITVQGTITVAEDVTATTMTVDLETTWAGTVTLSDGTKQQASSTSTVQGSVTAVGTGDDLVVTLEFANQGTLTIDGEQYPFSVNTAWSSETGQMSVTGSVNGDEIAPVTKPLELPAEGGVDDTGGGGGNVAYFMTCRNDTSCRQYVGAFPDWETSTVCEDLGMTKVTDKSCTSQGQACLVNQGSDYEYLDFSASLNESICEGEIGGLWVAI